MIKLRGLVTQNAFAPINEATQGMVVWDSVQAIAKGKSLPYRMPKTLLAKFDAYEDDTTIKITNKEWNTFENENIANHVSQKLNKDQAAFLVAFLNANKGRGIPGRTAANVPKETSSWKYSELKQYYNSAKAYAASAKSFYTATEKFKDLW